MNFLYLAEDYPYSKVHHQLCKHIVDLGKGINVIVYAVLRNNILSNDLQLNIYRNKLSDVIV